MHNVPWWSCQWGVIAFVGSVRGSVRGQRMCVVWSSVGELFQEGTGGGQSRGVDADVSHLDDSDDQFGWRRLWAPS